MDLIQKVREFISDPPDDPPGYELLNVVELGPGLILTDERADGGLLGPVAFFDERWHILPQLCEDDPDMAMYMKPDAPGLWEIAGDFLGADNPLSREELETELRQILEPVADVCYHPRPFSSIPFVV